MPHGTLRSYNPSPVREGETDNSRFIARQKRNEFWAEMWSEGSFKVRSVPRFESSACASPIDAKNDCAKQALEWFAVCSSYLTLLGELELTFFRGQSTRGKRHICYRQGVYWVIGWNSAVQERHDGAGGGGIWGAYSKRGREAMRGEVATTGWGGEYDSWESWRGRGGADSWATRGPRPRQRQRVCVSHQN